MAPFSSAYLWRLALGRNYLGGKEAQHVFETLSPVNSGTVFYAALTGVILWMAAMIGGWFDNWAVYHRLPQAIADHRLGERFGRKHMARAAGIVSRNMAGWGTNISLGFLLGLAPVFGVFLGLPIDVRHVTLSSGMLAFACARPATTGLARLVLLGARRCGDDVRAEPEREFLPVAVYRLARLRIWTAGNWPCSACGCCRRFLSSSAGFCSSEKSSMKESKSEKEKTRRTAERRKLSWKSVPLISAFTLLTQLPGFSFTASCFFGS